MSDPGAVPRDRFRRLEYPNDDFPYYAGVPVRLSSGQWLFVLAMVAFAFGVLVAPVPFFRRGLGQLVPAVLFPVIPLAALAFVTPRHWTALFRRIRPRDVLWMIAFAFLNVLVSLAVGLAVTRLFDATRNPAVAGLAERSAPEQVLFFMKTLPQLFGEEVLTILPFLGIMALLAATTRLSRRAMIVAAWLGSALLFALAHLPTYHWNLAQCLLVIGSARLVLTLPYVKTKNIWVSTGTHVLNDWFTFFISIAGAASGR